jgi:polyisoprenoid-binding protein YceI
MAAEVSASTPAVADASELSGVWRLDPERSNVEFHVRHFYGLVTVKGHFDRYQGTLELNATPAVHLTIESASLDTGRSPRDKHLRSPEFFDVEQHPQVTFDSDSVSLEGDVLKVTGTLKAAGKEIPVAFEASLRRVGDELEVSASTLADHRDLGMLWSPLGILRAPSKLIVQGRLVRSAN